MAWLVIRVRSDRGVERSIRETMSYLNLTKVNHAVIVPESDLCRNATEGKDFVTGALLARKVLLR